MKKLFVLAVAMLFVVSIAFAVNLDKPERAHKGVAEHLYLLEKDSSDWSVVENGSWGKLTYLPDKYVFNGHMLVPYEEYALISYIEPEGWPAEVTVQETGYADEYGDVHIMGDGLELECNDYDGVGGAKIWLVPTSDLTGDYFNTWDPDSYLFEAELLACEFEE